MSELVQEASSEDDSREALGITIPQRAGRLTVLEALAQETEAVSPNMSHQSTRQGSADFEDD